jgi:broad specificity phosphatase PhoE
MQSIYLVRHGEYSNPKKILAGRLPVELSKKGISQIKKVQSVLNQKDISVIYSSAVYRCKQTSEIIAKNIIPITYDKRLLETHSSYQGYWIYDWDHFFDHQEELGGESLRDIQKRMISFFEEIKTKEKGNVIIVSHGDPIYSLLLHLKRQSIPKKRGELSDYPQTGSITEVQISKYEEISIKTI